MTVPLSQTARFFLTRWRNTGWMAAGAIGFTLAASVGEVIVPLIVGALVQDLADGVHGNLLVWIAVFAGLRWAIAGLRYGAHRNYGLATTKAMREIAEEAFDRVLRLPSAWFARTHSAATVRGLTRGVWAFEDLSDEVLVDLAPTAFVILASLVVVLVKWPLLGLGLAVAVMAIVAAGAVLLFAVLGPARRRAMAADTEVAVSFSDAVTCNDLVKQAGAEAREAKRFAGAVGLWAERLRLTWLLTALVELGQSTILTLIVGGTLLGLIWLDPAVGPGEIAFFVTLAIVLEGHLRDVGLHLRLAQRAISEMESMVALLGEVAETDLPGKGIQRPRDGRIEMRGVRFRYPGAATLVYRGLDLTIADGERVAVVGASGAGKTTLIRLLTRCYDVEAGEIRLGGVPLSAIPLASLRAEVAVVPQNAALLDRSMAENIGYLSDVADRGEIARAAEEAELSDLLARLDQGLETRIGEGGQRLSGGERQRLALARAFLTPRRVLVLDEASSALDAYTEARIARVIDRISRGRTTLVIAHRLSTVLSADRILVLEHGIIVEDGPPSQLMNNPQSRFRQLFRMQLCEPAPAGGARSVVESEAV